MGALALAVMCGFAAANPSQHRAGNPLSSHEYLPQEINSIEQNVSWKRAKRRHGCNHKHSNRRYLNEDDDELFFDSNGMPINHDDDDDVSGIVEPTGMVKSDDGRPVEGDAAIDEQSQSEQPKQTGVDTVENKSESFSDKVQVVGVAEIKQLNNTLNHLIDENPADTILEDILRGFTFAFLFCICLVCIHRVCWYSCIRCGILPDDRLLEARWKRYQLKHKRAYAKPDSMDPRTLGKWFDQRDKMHPDGGIWDSSSQRSVGSWDDESFGALDFEDGIQLAPWNGDDASSATELEYGEGEELEDKRHDERLFDLDDEGAGLKKQANKFFGGSKRVFRNGKVSYQSNIAKTSEDFSSKVNIIRGNDVPDNAFFDALQPPTRRLKDELFVESANTSHGIQAPQQSKALPRQSNKIKNDANTFNEINTEHLNNDITLDDRGYDEESDLLGLRSDSPPPLDLEEIEKKMIENMENAQNFY